MSATLRAVRVPLWRRAWRWVSHPLRELLAVAYHRGRRAGYQEAVELALRNPPAFVAGLQRAHAETMARLERAQPKPTT